jgi:hypothetical protein
MKDLANYFKLILRPKVLMAIARLLGELGNALEDKQLTAAERNRVMSAFWQVVRVYRKA